MVRRIKEDIREIQGGFPKRHVVQLDIDGLPADALELKLSALLDEYRRLPRTTPERRKQTQASCGRTFDNRIATAVTFVD